MLKRLHKSFFILFSILFFVSILSFNVFAKPGDGWVCSGEEHVLGTNMFPTPQTITDPTGTSGYKRFNGLELFGDFGYKPVYYGEKAGSGDGFWSPQELSEDRYKDADISDSALTKMVQARTVSNCGFVGSFGSAWGGILLSIAYGFVYLARMLVSVALNPNFVCSQTGQTGCVDIASIVGGQSAGNTGLIGSFTNSLYFPLAFLAVLVGAIIVLYNTIVKRNVLSGFAGLLWLVLSFIVFGVLLLQPSLIARAPMMFNNAVSSCVVSAVSGGGCSTSSVPKNNTVFQGINSMCNGGVRDGKVDEQGSIVSSNLSCVVYKSLYLESLSQYVYGLSLEDMDLSNPNSPFSLAAKKAGIPSNRFCVPMGAINADGKSSNGLSLSGDRVCNGFLYQMYLQSGAKDSTGQIDKIGKNTPYFHDGVNKVDKRWYNIIEPMTHIKGGWETFSGQTSTGSFALFVPVLASITSSLFSIMFAGISTMFTLMSVILLIFFPFFALIGIVPGRGQYVFLSYAGLVISTVLKSVLAGLFLLIYVLIMGGLMGATSSVVIGIAGLVGVTLAFYKYRKEMFNLFAFTPNSNINNVGETLLANMKNKYGKNNNNSDMLLNNNMGDNNNANSSLGLENTNNNSNSHDRGQGGVLSDANTQFLNPQNNNSQTFTPTNSNNINSGVEGELNVAVSDLSRLNSIVDKLTAEQTITLQANNNQKVDLSNRLNTVHRLEKQAVDNVINNNEMLSGDRKKVLSNIIFDRQKMEKLKLDAAVVSDETQKNSLLSQAQKASVTANNNIKTLSDSEKTILNQVDKQVEQKNVDNITKPSTDELKDLSTSSFLLQTQTKQVKRISKQRNQAAKKHENIKQQINNLVVENNNAKKE